MAVSKGLRPKGRRALEREGQRPIETIDPTRNFTITLAERMRAMGGPPAWMVRRRTIEDVEADLLDRLELALQVSEDEARREGETFNLTALNKLIEQHNRYYPAEANLPMSPLTGELLERGKPWRPLRTWTLDALLERARQESS